MKRGRIFVLILCAIFAATILSAQETDPGAGEPKFAFQMAIALGAETFNEPDPSDPTLLTPVSYQMLRLQPDFSYGKFGIGLDVAFHYRFTSEAENNFDFRDEDWEITDDRSFAEVYLPLFRYIRWGEKGDDLFIKLGSVDDATLGNGFIMSNYANTNFLPEQRIFGLSFDLDGRLFNFPYLGIESFTANLAKFDVFGTRLYTRPLAWMEGTPLLPNLQIGATFAGDFKPDAHYDFVTDPSPDSVTMIGIDAFQPILGTDAVSLAVFGDFVSQEGASGGMIGFGGRLIKFLTYGFQVRFLGDNFIPAYFDASYDLFREEKYLIATSDATIIPSSVGAYTSAGFSILDDTIVFNTSVDWLFGDSDEDLAKPHLYAILIVKEGLIPGFFFDASYDKRYIDSFSDLVDPRDAVIGAHINYKTGPAVITLGYTLRYNPEQNPEWTTTANLSSSISLF